MTAKPPSAPGIHTYLESDETGIHEIPGGRELESQFLIERAKQEWECTVDALNALVCLLDVDARVIRANRVVEIWGLGPVSTAIGRSVHELLHPSCHLADCIIANGIRELHDSTALAGAQEREMDDAHTDRILQFTMRPILADGKSNNPSLDGSTVLVVSDITALRRTRSALEKANVDLESRVRLRTQKLAESNRDLRNEIVRREHAEQELRASRNDLAALTEQLIRAQERERRRIAIELHDSVGQSLSAIKYTIERSIVMLQRPTQGNVEEILTLAVKRIHETADDIRAISMGLRPRILDDLGAASAVSWLCREFSEVYPSIIIHAEILAKNQEIPIRIATQLFRCVEELMNNVAKHSDARNVWIELRREGMRLWLQVRDDGVGTNYALAGPSRLHGTGLRNLRERAEMTAGSFSHTSLPGEGTTARITWQLSADDEESGAS